MPTTLFVADARDRENIRALHRAAEIASSVASPARRPQEYLAALRLCLERMRSGARSA